MLYMRFRSFKGTPDFISAIPSISRFLVHHLGQRLRCRFDDVASSLGSCSTGVIGSIVCRERQRTVAMVRFTFFYGSSPDPAFLYDVVN